MPFTHTYVKTYYIVYTFIHTLLVRMYESEILCTCRMDDRLDTDTKRTSCLGGTSSLSFAR